LKQYVALIRGINVGGKNIVKMADLRLAFEKAGFLCVSTYIQSGNVLFQSDNQKDDIEKKIEDILHSIFNRAIKVVIVLESSLKKIINDAPSGFGDRLEKYHFDVMFLKKPLTPSGLIKEMKLREGVDSIYPGKGVVYFTRLNERLSQSYLSKITQMPIYQKVTIRNWNTTTKLLSLMEKNA
jgi:uncharacterized protein (DUF1697 family)